MTAAKATDLRDEKPDKIRVEWEEQANSKYYKVETIALTDFNGKPVRIEYGWHIHSIINSASPSVAKPLGELIVLLESD